MAQSSDYMFSDESVGVRRWRGSDKHLMVIVITRESGTSKLKKRSRVHMSRKSLQRAMMHKEKHDDEGEAV